MAERLVVAICYITTDMILMPWPSLPLSTLNKLFFFWIPNFQMNISTFFTKYGVLATYFQKKTLVSKVYTFIKLHTDVVKKEPMFNPTSGLPTTCLLHAGMDQILICGLLGSNLLPKLIK